MNYLCESCRFKRYIDKGLNILKKDQEYADVKCLSKNTQTPWRTAKKKSCKDYEEKK